VSAVPKPEPEPAPTPENPADAEGWALLEGLRRRLDDQAVQGRKTQQQVTQLAESIGALVEVQRRRSRWLNLNSFVAYVIFTVIVGAGFYFLYASRAHELVEARDNARRERDTAVRRADDTAAKLAARDAADQRAWEVYQLLEAGKRSEATTKLDSLGALPLSRTERTVLAARAHETQVMEVDAALKSAAVAFKAGRHADAIAPLEAALVGEPTGARGSSMRYFLGVAYAKSGQLDKAIANLQPALAVEAEHEDVRFQLASALDRSGAYAKARAEYDRFATAHPQSGFAAFAMRRSATLARMPAQAPAPAAPVTTPGPATPTQLPPNAAPATPNAATVPTPNAAAAAPRVTTAPGSAPRAVTTPPGSAAPPGSATPPPAPASPARAVMPQKQPAWKPKAPATKPAAPAPSPASPLPPPQPTPPAPAQPMGQVELPAIPPNNPPSSMPAPEPWPSRSSPPERTPAPEVTTPSPPPPTPPAAERLAFE